MLLARCHHRADARSSEPGTFGATVKNDAYRPLNWDKTLGPLFKLSLIAWHCNPSVYGCFLSSAHLFCMLVGSYVTFKATYVYV